MLNNSIQKFASTAEIYEQKLKVLIFFSDSPQFRGELNVTSLSRKMSYRLTIAWKAEPT